MLSTICCNRLATLLRYVATCCVLLAQVWKWSNFSANFFDVAWCCTFLATFVQHCCAWACARVLLSISKNRARYPTCRNIATRWPNVCNMLCPNMLWYFALKCCVRLASPFTASPNNVVICCVETLRSFGRGLIRTKVVYVGFNIEMREGLFPPKRLLVHIERLSAWAESAEQSKWGRAKTERTPAGTLLLDRSIH